MQVDSMVTCDVCQANDFLTDGDLPEDWEHQEWPEERDICSECLARVEETD